METVSSNTQIDRSAVKNCAYILTWENVYSRLKTCPPGKVWGIPRGGAIVAGLTGRAGCLFSEANVIVDDVLDSGATRAKFELMPHQTFWTLVDKPSENLLGAWVIFPWEESIEKEREDLVTRMIQMIGDDPSRDGLIETPGRVARSWDELFSGYRSDPKEHLKTFDRGTYDEMIVLKDCEFYSTCEHHLQPFFGKIHIGYIPGKKVIGISKLARIAECFARKLQIQERIVEQVTSFLMAELGAQGAGAVIEAKHFCICARGVNKQNSVMVTSSLTGLFRSVETRSEFLKLIK